jgi:TP901 family phage tail tape measure protein
VATSRVIYELIGMDRASPAFRKAGESAGALERGLAKLGRAIAVTGTTLAAGAVAGVTESVKMAVSFQTAMTKIQTQAGASAADVKQLSGEVLKLGMYAEQGPTDLANALFHLKSVGLDNADAMKALRQASDLAAVGGANLEDTTNALAGAWRSGIKGAETFGKTASTLNAIIGAGNMRMSDLTAALGTGILPAAKTFGVSLKSVGAALALMTDEGVPANDAATRLKMSLSLLGAPSAMAEKQLNSIGLTGLQLANAMRSPAGLIGAVGLLKSHLDASGLSASQAAALLSRAFGGGRSSSAILTMVNNLDVLRQKQNQINSSTGKFAQEVAAQRKTAQAQFALLKSSLDVLAVRLGSAVLPYLVKFVQYIGNTALPAVLNFGRTLANKLIPVDAIKGDALKKIKWGDLIVAALRGAISAADKIGQAFITILQAVNWQKVAAGAVAVIVTAVPAILNGLVVGLISEAVHHPLNLAAFLLALIPIGRAAGILGMIFKDVPILGKLVGWLTGPIVKAGGLVESALGKMLGKVFGPAQRLIGGYFKGGKTWLFAKGEEIILSLWYGAEGIWAKFTGWLSKLPATVKMKISGVEAVDTAEGAAAGAAGSGVFTRSFKKLLPVGVKLGQAGLITELVVKPVLQSLPSGQNKNWWDNPFGTGKKSAWNDWSQLGKNISGIWSGVYEHFQRDFAGKLTAWFTISLPHFFTSIPGKVSHLFTGARTWLNGPGKNVMSGFGDGMGISWPGVNRWLGRIGGWVKEPFSKARTWLNGPGKNVMSGFGGGMGISWPGVNRWLGRIGGWILGKFAQAGRWLIAPGERVISGMWSGAQTAWRPASAWLGRLGRAITGLFGRARTWLLSAGRNVLYGLGDGLYAAARGIGHWISQIGGWIVTAIKNFFGIRSPSTVMMPIGSHIITGLLHGMISKAGQAPAVIKKIFGSMPSALGALVSKGLVSIAGLPAKALKALGGLGGKIWGALFGGGDTSAHSGAAAAAQAFARRILSSYGWSQAQFSPLLALWNRESGWNPYAVNATSGAAGIPQALGHGNVFALGDYVSQVIWGLNYIRSRYGSPAAAWAHETAVGWYAKGTWGAAPGWAWVGEKGPELVRFLGGETVLDATTSRTAAARITTAAPPIYRAPAAASAAGGDGAAVHPVEVRVYIGDQEITGIVRTEVRENERALMRRVNAGTRTS